MTSGLTRTPSNEMVMAETFVQPWASPGHRLASRLIPGRAASRINHGWQTILALTFLALICATAGGSCARLSRRTGLPRRRD